MDRNLGCAVLGQLAVGSLSARRAWIEIYTKPEPKQEALESLSARRAWIEIAWGTVNFALRAVALRKESVDRNARVVMLSMASFSRSPQGERG